MEQFSSGRDDEGMGGAGREAGSSPSATLRIGRTARKASAKAKRLFVLEGGYGVQDGGAVGGEGAEDYAYQDRGGEGDDGGPVGDGDGEGREESYADGDGDADDGADETAGEGEEDGFGEELEADLAAGGAEGFADADLLDARLRRWRAWSS